MILRCLEVQGWRCFAGRVRLGEFSERLNVVHGPNGAGKSTLFQAMARGLLDSHRVGGEEAETLRPWGRELAPVAAVEFRHGGQEYRLTKRFLDRPSAELERREHGAWARAFESDAADNEVRRMLRASAPGRGLAQIRNWGLAQALWTPQGDLSLGELSGDLAADIRSMLGAQFAGPGGGRVEQRIEALYGQYFGKKTGAVKRGQHAPEAVRLGEKLKAAQAALADASRRLLEFEERSRRLEDIRAGKAQFRRDIDALQAALAAARRRAQEYAGLSLERERRAGQARAAEAEYQQLAQRIEAIQAAAADLSRTAAEGEKLGTALPDLVRAAAERRREAEQKRAALEDVRGTRAAVDAARNAAAQAAGYGAAGRQGAAASLRLEEVGGLEAAVAGIRAERAQLAAPSDTALRSIRKAAKERDDAQTRLESALIQVEVVPARAVDVTVLEGEQRGPRALEAGRPARFQGSPEIVLEIAGFGRVRAGGPASNAAEIRAERDKAAGRLARLTEPFGTADLDTLEALAKRAAALEGQAREQQARLEGLLAGKTKEDLMAELAAQQGLASEIERQRPEWREAPPDAARLAEAAAALERSFREELSRAELGYTTAEAAAVGAEKRQGEEAARLEQVRKYVGEVERRLEQLRADGMPDAERAAGRDRAALRWHGASAALEETKARLAEYGGDPAEEADGLDAQCAAATAREQEILKGESREEGALAEAAAEGPYDAMAAAEEQVSALSRDFAREQSRMNAVELLWKTVRDCRTKAVEAVAEPIETAATAMLHRIAGGRLGRIRLGDGFVPENLAISSAGAPVALSDVSGGEREQIFLATRLALADVLAREERQLALLDDVLTATDTGRMARILRLLEESAEKVQVVILTCHPERYAALDGAKFFDLEQLPAARAATA